MIKIKKKVIIVGSYMVGKTAILNSFVHHKFVHDYKSTMGVNIMAKEYLFDERDIELTFIIWDVGGQNMFQNMARRFYNKAEAAFIVYDITRRNTFSAIKEWYSKVIVNVGYKIPIILIGNKIDLYDQREVETSEGKKLADELKIEFLETSAKTRENVDLAFRNLGEKMLTTLSQVQEKIN
ncbi:MAG: Rab family GTPase [Candidatus Helarchaeota archaeon]